MHYFFLDKYYNFPVLSALASFSWADMHVVQAATVDKPRVVTEKDQTISDDFGSDSHPVSITDGRTMAVLEIAPSAAADDKGVTTVNSNTINGKFTQPADRGFAEAIGVLVQDNYPGTVQLADG